MKNLLLVVFIWRRVATSIITNGLLMDRLLILLHRRGADTVASFFVFNNATDIGNYELHRRGFIYADWTGVFRFTGFTPRLT